MTGTDQLTMQTRTNVLDIYWICIKSHLLGFSVAITIIDRRNCLYNKSLRSPHFQHLVFIIYPVERPLIILRTTARILLLILYKYFYRIVFVYFLFDSPQFRSYCSLGHFGASALFLNDFVKPDQVYRSLEPNGTVLLFLTYFRHFYGEKERSA